MNGFVPGGGGTKWTDVAFMIRVIRVHTTVFNLQRVQYLFKLPSLEYHNRMEKVRLTLGLGKASCTAQLRTHHLALG